jgi:bifunctional non-homologous end joining protein LigD
VKAPRAEVRGAHWLKPKLVAEIAYTEMTNEGTLRHPSYLGLREDKKPEAVVLEKRSAGRSRRARGHWSRSAIATA